MDWTKININNIYQNDKQSIQWMQRQLGVKDDGIIGEKTIKALQRMVGTKDDGIWGNNSRSAATQYFSKFGAIHQVPQATSDPKSMLQRSSTSVRPFFVPFNEPEVVIAAGMEDVPQVESPQQTEQPKQSRFVENLSKAMTAFGMHNSQNAEPIQDVPQKDMFQYDVVFPENWGGKPNLVRTVQDSYYDWKNRNKWKEAVTKHDGETTVTNNYGNEVPQVNMNWNISKDQIARALALLPELDEDSAPEWKGSTYDQTWDKQGYKESNQTILTQALESLPSNTAQMAVTSLSQPGRGTLGSFSYRTTPEGIEISDGYQFAADPSKLRSTSAQGEAYTEERLNMANNYRAANGTTQRYFIPWSAYKNIRQNYPG